MASTVTYDDLSVSYDAVDVSYDGELLNRFSVVTIGGSGRTSAPTSKAATSPTDRPQATGRLASTSTRVALVIVAERATGRGVVAAAIKAGTTVAAARAEASRLSTVSRAVLTASALVRGRASRLTPGVRGMAYATLVGGTGRWAQVGQRGAPGVVTALAGRARRVVDGTTQRQLLAAVRGSVRRGISSVTLIAGQASTAFRGRARLAVTSLRVSGSSATITGSGALRGAAVRASDALAAFRVWGSGTSASAPRQESQLVVFARPAVAALDWSMTAGVVTPPREVAGVTAYSVTGGLAVFDVTYAQVGTSPVVGAVIVFVWPTAARVELVQHEAVGSVVVVQEV